MDDQVGGPLYVPPDSIGRATAQVIPQGAFRKYLTWYPDVILDNGIQHHGSSACTRRPGSTFQRVDKLYAIPSYNIDWLLDLRAQVKADAITASAEGRAERQEIGMFQGSLGLVLAGAAILWLYVIYRY